MPKKKEKTEEFLTMTEAIEYLGVSPDMMWRLVRDGRLLAFEDQLDRRKKLLKLSDLKALKTPRPMARSHKTAHFPDLDVK